MFVCIYVRVCVSACACVCVRVRACILCILCSVYIVKTERTIMDTLGGINEKHTIAKVTAERRYRGIDDDWHSRNFVRIVADIAALSCMMHI